MTLGRSTPLDKGVTGTNAVRSTVRPGGRLLDTGGPAADLTNPTDCVMERSVPAYWLGPGQYQVEAEKGRT